MGDMIYLIAGYAVFVLLMLGYVYSLASRQKGLEREVERLHQIAQSETPDGA